MKRNVLILLLVNIILLGSSFAQNENNVNVKVEVQQEVFPVISKFVSEGNNITNLNGLVSWEINNGNTDSVRVVLTSELQEWTAPVISTVILGPGENKKVNQTPFGINLLRNYAEIPAALLLKAQMNDRNIFHETRNVRIRATDTMIWSLFHPFDMKELIAAWVTPKDPLVEQILTNAKEKMSDRTLKGYQRADITPEVNAIFNAVRNTKISYVNSAMTFGKIGFTQRIRLPKLSIIEKSANCIDGAVLFASLFENLGLESFIVLIPGHAFVGVRLKPNSRESLFIETTMVGRRMMESILTLTTTFNAAVQKGNEEYDYALKNNPNQLFIIDIKKEREKGIYPLW